MRQGRAGCGAGLGAGGRGWLCRTLAGGAGPSGAGNAVGLLARRLSGAGRSRWPRDGRAGLARAGAGPLCPIRAGARCPITRALMPGRARVPLTLEAVAAAAAAAALCGLGAANGAARDPQVARCPGVVAKGVRVETRLRNRAITGGPRHVVVAIADAPPPDGIRVTGRMIADPRSGPRSIPLPCARPFPRPNSPARVRARRGPTTTDTAVSVCRNTGPRHAPPRQRTASARQRRPPGARARQARRSGDLSGSASSISAGRYLRPQMAIRRSLATCLRRHYMDHLAHQVVAAGMGRLERADGACGAKPVAVAMVRARGGKAPVAEVEAQSIRSAESARASSAAGIAGAVRIAPPVSAKARNSAGVVQCRQRGTVRRLGIDHRGGGHRDQPKARRPACQRRACASPRRSRPARPGRTGQAWRPRPMPRG